MGEMTGGFDPQEFQIEAIEYDPKGFRRDRTPEEKSADHDEMEMLRAAAKYEGMASAREKAVARENGEIAPAHVHTPSPKHLEDLDYRPERSN